MKIIIEEKSISKEFDGELDLKDFSIKVKSTFDVTLNNNYTYIKVETTNGEKYTLFNCSLFAYHSNTIYSYEFFYYINGWVDKYKFTIDSFSLVFNELQYIPSKSRVFFSDNTITIDTKEVKETLYENKDLIIYYTELPGIDDKTNVFEYIYNKCIFVQCKKTFLLDDLFIVKRYIENILGFAISKKMTLNELCAYDNKKRIYTIVTKSISNKRFEVIPYISDLSIIKNIFKNYFEENRFKLAIDAYYENIFNELDPVLVLINLCNCMEIIGHNKVIYDDYKLYKDENRKILSKNTEMKCGIKKLLFFLQNKIENKPDSLKEKLYYFFVTSLHKHEKKDNYIKCISKINRTRNYYVHGNNYSSIYQYNELYVINDLLKYMLHLLIFRICNVNGICDYYIKTITEWIEVIEKELKI